MNETEDDFVRHTRQQWEAMRLDKSSFDEARCREIYRRTRHVQVEPPAAAVSFTVGEQFPLL
jgi:hypothetical protein